MTLILWIIQLLLRWIKIFKTGLTTNKKTSGRQVSMLTSLLGPVSIYRSISGSRRQPRAWCDLHLMTSQLPHTTYLRTRCSYAENTPAVRNIRHTDGKNRMGIHSSSEHWRQRRRDLKEHFQCVPGFNQVIEENVSIPHASSGRGFDHQIGRSVVTVTVICAIM